MLECYSLQQKCVWGDGIAAGNGNGFWFDVNFI